LVVGGLAAWVVFMPNNGATASGSGAVASYLDARSRAIPQESIDIRYVPAYTALRIHDNSHEKSR